MRRWWISVELSSRAEALDDAEIVASLQVHLRRPAEMIVLRGAGYVLVTYDESERYSFAKSSLVTRVLRKRDGSPELLQDRDISALRARLRQERRLKVGYTVAFLEGPYAGLQGRLERLRKHSVGVRVVLRAGSPLVWALRSSVQRVRDD